jgi:hypothetical protein
VANEKDEIEELALAYKRKTDEKAAFDAQQAADLKTARDEAPKLWARLREQIKKNVDKFNTTFGGQAISWDDIHSDRVVMTRRADNTKLEGGFDASVLVAFFRSPVNIDLTLKVVVQAGVADAFMVESKNSGGHVRTIEEIATDLIRDFVTQ